MNLQIKNMVCNRCILVVKQIFEQAGVQPVEVGMGEVRLQQTPSATQFAAIQSHLQQLGFEILNDEKSQTIEKIKSFIIQTIQKGAADEQPNFSVLLSRFLHKDYSYLSKLFSEAENITIEKFIIQQKIEKVKELLTYGELSLSEIAFQVGYSSVAHLSNQFKHVTGFTPSAFRKLKDHRRKSLDQL